jgi:K+-sensing histidine kinase KdpD
MRDGIDTQSKQMGAAAGAIAAILVAGGLVGLRSVLDNTSVALVLVLVIVAAAAIGGRRAGVVTAVMAGLAFDFFHTEPYGRLTIDSAQDVETVVLLVAVGLAAGEVVVRSRRIEQRGDLSHRELERVRRVADVAVEHPDDVVATVANELRDGLGLEGCWFEEGPTTAVRPQISRRGAIDQTKYRLSGGEFELPPDQVALPVRAHGGELGRFVLVPTPGIGVARDKRLAASCIADITGLSLEDAAGER